MRIISSRLFQKKGDSLKSLTASERLGSEQGRRVRSKRSVDVEAGFGRLTQNWEFRRFISRGLENVSAEWGILSVAHNIARVAVA